MTNIGTHNQSNRDKWLKETLLKIPNNSKILDAGAGELKYKGYCSHLEYTSQDFDQYDGKGDNKGLQTNKWDKGKVDIVSDITNIPKLNNSFDAILCVKVFEHLPEPVLAIKEFNRLLKTDGYLILTAPFCSLTHFAPYHFYSGFNRYFYEKHLPENGFEIIELSTNGNFFEYLAQEIRRIEFMMRRYTDVKLTSQEVKILQNSLFVLDKLNSNQHNSEEMLCFDYQVFARKI